jgi:hypothetical protein
MKTYSKLTIINNINKIKTKLLTILFLLLSFSSQANAEALKISTKNACNFLEEFGLKAQSGWKKTSESQWGCSYNQNPANITNANFSFLASGHANEVKNIEIKAEVIDKKYLRLVEKKLVDISSSLINVVFDSLTANQIKESINNYKNFSFQNESSIINFVIDEKTDTKPLTMTIKINSK